MSAATRTSCGAQLVLEPGEEPGPAGAAVGGSTQGAATAVAAAAREAQGSTAVGMGVAIPHAKSDGADKPMVAFARPAATIDWNGAESADLVFLISVPSAQAGTEHLRILAKLSRALVQTSFREGLKNAATPEEIVTLVADATRADRLGCDAA